MTTAMFCIYAWLFTCRHKNKHAHTYTHGHTQIADSYIYILKRYIYIRNGVCDIYLFTFLYVYIYIFIYYMRTLRSFRSTRFAIKWQGSHPSGIFMCLHCARYFTADMSSACAKAPRAEREVTTQKLHHDSGQKHPNQSKSYVLVHPAATRENINSNISRPLATGLRWVSSVCETAPNRSGTHP